MLDSIITIGLAIFALLMLYLAVVPIFGALINTIGEAGEERRSKKAARTDKAPRLEQKPYNAMMDYDRIPKD